MNLAGSDVHNGRARSPPPGPFGYSFLSPFDTPAPAPPPGPALLDDSESNMLDNFFTTMNSSHLDTSDLWFRSQQQTKATGNLNIDWSEELPPTFEGSATTLSQPSLLHHSMEKGGLSSTNNGMDTSSDILAAASMLYQNGMNGSDFGSTFTHQLFPEHTFTNMNGEYSTTGGFSKNMRSGDQLAMKESSPHISRKQLPHGFHAPEMLFDVQQPVPMDQQTTAKVRTLRWGSDASFMDQGYLVPPNQHVEERTKELLDKLECLEPQSSAANTRAPSPARVANNGEWTCLNGNHPHNGLRNGDNMDDMSQPRKRQKSKVKDEEDSDVEGSKSKTKRSKGSNNDRARRTSNDSMSRKSKQSGAKATRENLTEEQKRTNHILSEQKRRNLIKQGFDELCSLVPELRGGGFSKSAMLIQGADWLEDMIHGNELLKAQLSELKAMNGIAIPR